MALKGSATIELTNADGTKEVIKHDNMITNAVADLCFSQRGEMATILKMTNNNDSYAQAMFGGLLLFDEVLNSDPADYQIPTTKITGYASQDAYAGLDLARGSFNQAEGGVQEDGSYKFVWDFATSQGNGTIKSISLCPNVMGKIGASDTIVLSETSNFYVGRGPSEPFNASGYMLDSSGSTNGISNYNYVIVAIDGDIAYATDNRQVKYYNDNKTYTLQGNGGILNLHRFKLGSTSISLADRVGMARYIDCIDAQMPSAFVNQLGTSEGGVCIEFYYDKENKKITISPVNLKVSNIAVNEHVYYVDLDIADNMKATLRTFTNTTGGVLKPNSSSWKLWFIALSDYIIVKSYVSDAYRMYIVNRNDNTDIKEVQFAGEPYLGTALYETFYMISINKNCFVFGQWYGDNYYYTCILDLSTGVLKKTNARSMRRLSQLCNKAVGIETGSYLKYYLDINPFILTTKNNLDSPVTKTASQTMKITYTLSEVV